MKKTILVVEDSRVLRKLYAYVLDAEGFNVLEAESSADALDKLRNPVDLILAGLCSTRFDGVGLVRTVRSLASHHATPVVMLSDERDHHRIPEAQKAGVDHFLQKPCDAPKLLAALGALLGDPDSQTQSSRLLCAA